jgi:hypothetical protein
MASLYYHVFSPVGIAYSISILLASVSLVLGRCELFSWRVPITMSLYNSTT